MNQIIFTHLGKKFKKVRYVFFVILPNLGTDTLKTLNEKKSTKLSYLHKVGKHSIGKTTQKNNDGAWQSFNALPNEGVHHCNWLLRLQIPLFPFCSVQLSSVDRKRCM